MLLDCFGFGSVASVACAKYILAHKLNATSLHELFRRRSLKQCGDFEDAGGGGGERGHMKIP